MSGGRDSRPIGAYELAKAVEELGAGEILLNCIDCDGMLWYFYKDFSLLCSAICIQPRWRLSIYLYCAPLPIVIVICSKEF